MRVLLLNLLFACFLLQSLGRPQQMDYDNDNNVDEEEDENEPASEDTLADDEDTPLNDQEPAVQDEEAQYNRHVPEGKYLVRDTALERRPTDASNDDFPGYKPNTNGIDQVRMAFKTRQLDKYSDGNDANDQHETAQHLTNRDVNKANHAQNPRDNQNIVNKRTTGVDRTFNEDGEMLFPNNRDPLSKMDKSEYNNKENPSEQSRFLKQYYNTIHAENRGMVDDKSHESAHYNLRDRRNTKETGQDVLNSPTLDKSVNEDEESAIKRHIKKLSGDELEQLLNSLSEEKRELLKKIINEGDTVDNGFINKREIIKKSGAVEENNLVETGQSDLSKVQSSASIDINSESSANQNSETTEVNKQTDSRTESTDISTPKPADTSNGFNSKVELTSQNDEVTQKKSDIDTFSSNLDTKNQAEISSNLQVMSKTDNKRETNLNDLENADISFDDSAFLDNDLDFKVGMDYLNDEGYFSSQDEKSPQFNDEGDKYHNEDSKAYKREVFLEEQPDLTESIKSLEESFPNSHAYHDSVPYSGPLIRVKRTNSVKKRSAALLPDAKVAYFPYKAENDDEDDEGNEFEDEGFYDRTSNFANSNKALEDDAFANSENDKQLQRSGNENPESDTMSLGSDTDSVLSGVEGVDDNLMYSCSRSRRTAEDISSNDVAPKSSKTMQSTSLTDDLMKTALENTGNFPHYQENDAFGPLPRNYERDLGRYKRIRRLKQSHKSDDPIASDITSV